MGSFVEMWKDLGSIIQSEVNQKTEYCILGHICGVQKNGIDDLICKTEIETEPQRTNVWTPCGEGEWDEWGDCD